MANKTVYLYDAATGELKGTYEAQESPLEPGKYIEPAHSTEIASAAAAADEVAVFVAGAWTPQPDYRGQTIYSQATGIPEVVTSIGAIPSGYGLTAPNIPVSLKTQAVTALASTDGVVIRVQEAISLGKTTASAADVVAYMKYRAALRAIVNGTDTTSTALPVTPPYPANT